MSLSLYLQRKLQDHYLKVAAFTQPANLYASCHTADPGETGASESAITRILMTGFTAASNTSPTVSNPGADVVFTNGTGSSVTVTHIGVFDALTTGNFLVGGALAVSKVVPNGAQLTILAADFDVTLD